MATDTSADFDMDALLDGTLDDLADMPEFKPYNPGLHRCAVSITQKKVNDFPVFEVALKNKETVEPAAGEDPVAEGAETSCMYFMKHSNPKVAELGQGKFKMILAAAAVHFGAKSNRELINDINGSEAIVATGLRDNKEKTKKFTDIVEMNWA